MPPTPREQKQLAKVFTKLSRMIEQGQTAAAIQQLEQMQRRMPKDINVMSLIARAHAKMGRHAETIDAYARAVEAHPKVAELRMSYAIALQRGGRYDQALLEYERTLYYAPDHFYARRHKVSVLTDLNRLEEAHKEWAALRDRFAKQDPDQDRHHDMALAVAISGARLAPQILDAQDAIDGINAHLPHAKEDSLKTAALYQLGRLHHALKQYDDAFASYRACKQIDKRPWDPDDHSTRIDRLIDCWCTDQPIPFSGVDGSRIIFVVGMMRSGTSLTEQMLAQIDNVTPGGEMNTISRLMGPMERDQMKHGRSYPSTRANYIQKNLRAMASTAMKMYNEVARQGIVTDKQPYNFAFVPLIAHMLPGCKIIHCVRDPLDTCLSNFTQAFARPHPQTHDLYWLGRYFADYERLMKAWHTVEEVDMIDLTYEKLVADPETEFRRVTDFLGLPWSDDILRFHESDRTINTASRDQVRKPLYKSAVKKHTPYEHHLDELKRGIEEGRAWAPARA